MVTSDAADADLDVALLAGDLDLLAEAAELALEAALRLGMVHEPCVDRCVCGHTWSITCSCSLTYAHCSYQYQL